MFVASDLLGENCGEEIVSASGWEWSVERRKWYIDQGSGQDKTILMMFLLFIFFK